MQQTIRGASAIILDDQRRILLVLRGEEPEKGLWSVPGGSCEPGESFAEAASREAFEETGLHVAIDRELWVATVPAGDGRVFELHDFEATVIGGQLTPGDDADAARWFTQSELGSIPLTHDLLGYLNRAEVFGPAES